MFHCKQVLASSLYRGSPRAHAAVLLFACLAGCGDGSTLVAVTLSGRADTVRTMRVEATINQTLMTPVVEYPGADQIGLNLRADAPRGPLSVRIDALDDRCVVQRGYGTVQTTLDPQVTLTVPLTTLAAPLCTCSPEGFCWEHPTPQGNYLRRVWGFSKNDIWAVGDLGTILHYDGKAWTSMPLLDSERRQVGDRPLVGIWGARPDDIWAVGDAGLILHYDGKAWTVNNNGIVSSDLLYVFGTSANDVWALGFDSTILRSDGVHPWRVVNRFEGDPGMHKGILSTLLTKNTVFRSMGRGRSGDLWIVGKGGTVLRGDATGTTWSRPITMSSTVTYYGVLADPQGGDGVWLVGDNGTAQVLTLKPDLSWNLATVMTGTTDVLSAIWPGSEGSAWVISGDIRQLSLTDTTTRRGNLYRWSGTSFQSQAIPGEPKVTSDLYGLWGDGGDLWTVGHFGALYHVIDKSLASVQVIPDNVGLPLSLDLHAAWGGGPEDVWVAGTDVALQAGALAHWDGKKWSPEVLPSGAGPMGAAAVNAMWGSGRGSDATIWAVGDQGQVLYKAPGDTIWTTAGDSTTTVDKLKLNGVWGSGPDNIWVVGEKGNLYHRTGGKWQAPVLAKEQVDPLTTRPVTDDLYSVWGSPGGTIWAVGGTKILRLDPSADSWQAEKRIEAAFATDLMNKKAEVHFWSVFGSGPNDVWVIVEGILPVPTTDLFGDSIQAQTWIALHWDGTLWKQTPLTDVQTHNITAVDQRMTGWASGPDDAWVAGRDGRLLHWDGRSWNSTVRSGTRNDLYRVFGTGPGDVWLLGQGSTALRLVPAP